MKYKSITVYQFKSAIKSNKITRWDTRSCSLCNTPIGYVFTGSKVEFDSSCKCVVTPSPLMPRSWIGATESFNSIIRWYNESPHSASKDQALLEIIESSSILGITLIEIE